MRSLPFKILLGGLAVMLALTACVGKTPTVVPTVIPTVPAATNTPIPTVPPVINTAVPTAASLPILASPSIQSLDMLDVNNGWALTDAAVVRTTDGGATWYNVTPAGLSGAPAASFFLDAATGWVVLSGADPTSGTLYHTTDGGVTWTSAPVPFGGGSLEFVDPTHGWELNGLGGGMSHQAVAVFRTSDGGTTWSQVFTDDPTASGSSDSLPFVGDKNGITALDANHAWVTGAEPMSDFIYIYTTQDGGTTWTFQNLTFPAGYSGAMTSANLPVFFGLSDAVLPVLLLGNTNGAEFYVSHDSGQTWTLSTPVAQGGFLAVASAKDFFVWDGSAPLNVSHDAGASWSNVTPNVNIKDSMLSFQFVNASTGWALTSDASSHHVLYKTTDGGQTWVKIVP